MAGTYLGIEGKEGIGPEFISCFSSFFSQPVIHSLSQALVAAIIAYLESNNANPKPFVRTA